MDSSDEHHETRREALQAALREAEVSPWDEDDQPGCVTVCVGGARCPVEAPVREHFEVRCSQCYVLWGDDRRPVEEIERDLEIYQRGH